MKCPHCPDTTLSMSERQGIEIDYCPDCRGIWLDRGELDKLIEKASLDATQASKPNKEEPRHMVQETIYKEELYKNNHYKHKRKKSFLEELFD